MALRRSHTSIPLLLLSWLLRLILFCASAITLGIFSYFLATLTDHSLHIATWVRAVEGIAGASVLYSILACTFVLCCGGIAVFSMLAMVLDVGFIGAWIYVVYKVRKATNGCGTGKMVQTPIGSGVIGNDNTVTGGDGGVTILPSFKTACRLQEVVFGVGIVAIVIYLLALLLELLLRRSHRKSNKFGPSPNNNYTSGRRYGAGFFSRFNRKKTGSFYPEKQNPDALTATHPQPLGHVAPAGTALDQDVVKDSHYASAGNGVDGGYGNGNPYSGVNAHGTVN